MGKSVYSAVSFMKMLTEAFGAGMKKKNGRQRAPTVMSILLLLLAIFALPGVALTDDAGGRRDQVNGQAYLNEGDAFFRAGANNKALEKYEKAAVTYEGMNAPEAAGLAYVALGNVHLRRGENVRAGEMFARARALFIISHSRRGEGLVYLGMGNLHLRARAYVQAREMYEKALANFTETKDLAGQGQVYRNLGEIAMRTGNNSQAMKDYEGALVCFSDAQDVSGRGSALRSIGEAYYYVGNNDLAEIFYTQALALFQQTGHILGEADVLRRKGQIYLRLGDHDRALALFQQDALPRYRQMEEPVGQADVYKDMGDIFYYFRDYARALEFYDKAQPLYMKVDDPIGQGNVSRSMGDIFMRTGDDKRAVAAYLKAQEFYRRADSPIGRGNVFHSLGDMYLQDGNLKKAEEIYRLALPFYEKANTLQGQGNAHRGLGDVSFGRGDYRAALAAYNQALSCYERSNSTYGQGRTYQSIGDVLVRLADPETSLIMYDRAAEFYRKMADIELEAYAFFRKAAVLNKAGKKKEALSLYEAGLAKLEKVRKQTIFAEMKKGYLEKVYDYFEDAAVFMLENQYDDKAFRTIEAMKARTFLDQLSEGQVGLEKGIDPGLRKERDRIENTVTLLLKKLGEEGQKMPPQEEKLTALRRDLAGEEERLEKIKREIRFRNPLYASVHYPEPITMAELQKNILRSDEALIEYFLTGQGVYCFVIDKDQHQVLKLPVTLETLDKNLESFLMNIQGALQGVSFDKHQASILYKQLVKPIEHLLEQKALIIVPHGKIAFLPFESLMMGNPGEEKYLIEKYHIKYIQSASVLGVLRMLHKKEATSRSFLGFGDPVYDYENYRQGKPEAGEAGAAEEPAARSWTKRGYFRAGGRLSRLTGSGREVKEIGAIFQEKGLPARTLLRTAAREEKAKEQETKDYGYIHFSTHGILGPKFQAIALAQVPQGNEDGFLTLGEIMNSRYNADLIVLSACETGLGHIDRGEGVTGLTRAVMYAGSPAAIVSLWSVSDDGTTELMIHFYLNLIQKSMGKEESLRMAKIAMLRGDANGSKTGDGPSLRSVKVVEKPGRVNFRHPFFWAAFVMYGE